MSKLQNNFTTLEQSKRLLKLGVPANSADCLRESEKHNDGKVITYREAKEINEYQQFMNDVSYENAAVIPCWSVGRLIEIFEICTQHKFKRVQQTDDLVYLSPIEDVLMQIEHNACGFYDNTKWEINLLNK